MEQLFKTFLEDGLFIPAVNQSNRKIMKCLKKYHPAIYKKEGSNIRQILNEFSVVNTGRMDKNAYFKLKKICQKMVFLLAEAKDLK